MKPRSTRKRFLELIDAVGHSLNTLAPAVGIEVMSKFYKDERVDGCDLAEDGDMLLHQWGCNDWGDGESFELNITRQLMAVSGDDEEIRQLSLTFKFEPTDSLRKAGSGNRWCSTPSDLKSFRTFINGSAAMKAVAKLQPAKVTLTYNVAG
jgi:hypothetical protein